MNTVNRFGDRDTSITQDGPLSLDGLSIPDLPTGGAIGTAVSTVDTKAVFMLNQSTAGQEITLPAPTDTTREYFTIVSNLGTASTKVNGVKLVSQAATSFLWNGTSWQSVGGTGGGGGVIYFNGEIATDATIMSDKIDLTSPDFAGLKEQQGFLYIGEDGKQWHYDGTQYLRLNQYRTTGITPEYYDGAAWVSAQANDTTTVCQTIKLSTGERITSGRVYWAAHGLTVGADYYLSDTTLGGVTDTKPQSGNQIKQALFTVEDANWIVANVSEWEFVDGATLVSTITPVVYTGGAWVAAQADADANLCDMIDLGDEKVSQCKVRTLTPHGFEIGAWAYLSQDIAGGIVTVQPTRGIIQRIGYIEDSNTIALDVQAGVNISAGGVLTFSEPLNIAGVVKPSNPPIDFISLVDDGSGYCEVHFCYVAGAGGVIGSHNYEITLPNGYEFDILTSPYANIGANLSTLDYFMRLGGTNGSITDGTNYGDIDVIPTSPNTFGIYTALGWWGSSVYSTSSTLLQGFFRFKKA